MPELRDRHQVYKDSNSLYKESFPKVGLSANATAFDPLRVPSKGQYKGSIFNEYSEGTSCPEAQGISSSLARTSSSASSASDRGGATSTSAGRGLSPSSSVASLSLEKSTLNPNAKEFKFNANAKNFVPFQSLRPASPVAETSFYYPALHGMPSGVGYGQQMTVGQHRPVYYMPNHPHEMQYK